MVCGSDDGDEDHGWVTETEGCEEDLPELGELGGFEGGAEEWNDGGVVDEGETDDEGVTEMHTWHGCKTVDELALHEDTLSTLTSHGVDEAILRREKSWGHAWVDGEYRESKPVGQGHGSSDG